ncbi:MAG: hypothetical protein A4E63_03222 [Syntrophorhabdus sp. PtaU1.Bin050]|nr:MAG: hypothetical protein A4E63_03222 [Syntrophorhabdus sp. PtaU1.Bin050]
MFRVNLNKGNVCLRISSDHCGVIFLPVNQFHLYALRPFYNMVIGQDIPLAINDEARTQAFLLEFPPGSITEKSFKKIIAEEVLEGGRRTGEPLLQIRTFYHRGRAYVHHRRSDCLYEATEARQVLIENHVLYICPTGIKLSFIGDYLASHIDKCQYRNNQQKNSEIPSFIPHKPSI